MKIRCVYLAAGNQPPVWKKNKLFHTIGQKPMYLHLLDRLAAVAERHKDLEIVVVSQYEELLQEASGEGPRPVCDPSVEKERRALLAGLWPSVSCIQPPEPGGSIPQHPGRDPGGNAGIQPDLWNVQAGGRARAGRLCVFCGRPAVAFRKDRGSFSGIHEEGFRRRPGKPPDRLRFPPWGSREIRCGSLHFIRMSFWLCPGTGRKTGHESPYGPGTFF